jgi:two-component system phosphate regulon sensor histidine kinase PhoR
LFKDVYDSTEETQKERNTPLLALCDTEYIVMDYDLMKSLLINLIDNASKASEPGMEIILRAHDNTIEVSDRGVGMPAEEISRVSDTFYMADRSRSKKTGGSGLGLTLVKCIADAHGADLIIESESKVGTTVSVVFPDGRKR